MKKLPKDVEERFDERFPNSISGYIDKNGNHVCLFDHGVDVREIKAFLSSELERQREEFIKEVEKLPETYEVESDGELLEVFKGVCGFKEEVLAILKKWIVAN